MALPTLPPAYYCPSAWPGDDFHPREVPNVPGRVQEMYRCGIEGCGSVGTVVTSDGWIRGDHSGLFQP